ncbi:MAG TPA: dCTP deaminase [Acidimicrobiales bacterium]|nr:dCTP deaminase [Acidimicrobiales bacterium]
MILSDRTIRQELEAGRIVIDPLGEGCIQPSSVDLHVDRYFRVFRNHTMRVIDVKEDQENLTELVEMRDGEAFILHPGEFVLGSTAERVRLPDDLVARLEGKSSLGRLGLLIHSSLPGSERVLVRDAGGLRLRPVGEIVAKRLEGEVVGFDPDSLDVGYHRITGWYEGAPDRIYEVALASGRRVRVTAGHNLFTLDRDGCVRKTRTAGLAPGTRVAVARRVPDPHGAVAELRPLDLAPEAAWDELVVQGPVVDLAFAHHPADVADLLAAGGFAPPARFRRAARLPASVLHLLPTVAARLGPEDRVAVRGGRSSIPAVLPVDDDLAWLLGLAVGAGRRGHLAIRDDRAVLDRVQAVLGGLGVVARRNARAVSAGSAVLALVLGWLSPDGGVPAAVLGWPRPLLAAFLDGVGRRTAEPGSRLADDLLYLEARAGRRPAPVPLPDRLLVDLAREAGLDPVAAGRAMLRRKGADLGPAALDHLLEHYRAFAPGSGALPRLERLAEGGLLWDTVVEVRDTGEVETVYDLEVQPGGRKVENFLAGTGGVFVSNTAGFVDAGFEGHLTLELSNVANLPITLYPGMKIGQISFLRMTTPAETPYGSKAAGSKYQGQRGPTPSRYSENFRSPS